MSQQQVVSSKGHSSNNKHSDRRNSNRNNCGVSSGNGAIYVDDDLDLPSESDDEDEQRDCVHDINGDGEEADVEDQEEEQDKVRAYQDSQANHEDDKSSDS